MLVTIESEENVPTPQPKSHARIARVSKFGVVGIINTLLDFVIFNVLSSVVGLTLVQSNAISTTIAMAFSFAANKKIVFKHNPRTGSLLRQGLVFFAVTAFGLYVLQSGTIKILTELWLGPVAIIVAAAHALNIHGHDQFIIKNSAKAVATVVSLTWNYVMYKKVVFS